MGLRIAIVPDHPDSLIADIRDTMALRLRYWTEQPYLLTIGSLGAFVPLVLLFPRRLFGLARRHPEAFFFVLFFYGLCLPANNTERELGYTLPVVLPASLLALRSLVAEARLPLLPTLAVAVALQAFFFSQQRYLEMGSSMHQPTNLAVVAVMATAWIAAQLLLLRRAVRTGVQPAAARSDAPSRRSEVGLPAHRLRITGSRSRAMAACCSSGGSSADRPGSGARRRVDARVAQPAHGLRQVLAHRLLRALRIGLVVHDRLAQETCASG